MKKRDYFFRGLGGVLSVLFLAGCGTTLSPIEQRIQKEYAFFAALPEDEQERLRGGRVEIGDSMDAAWIVYGKPTKSYERLTEASVNMVWSYSTTELHPVDQFETTYYPVTGRRGVTRWSSDLQLQRSYLHDRSENLRIEFREGKVIAIDLINP